MIDMAGIEAQQLHGRWVRANEEDTESEMVLRPADEPLPPARGRTAFEFHPDGTYTERYPGPVDVPEQSTGSWSLEGDQLVLEAEGPEPTRTWEIKAADPDRITVRT
jgi:hypothetical protein